MDKTKSEPIVCYLCESGTKSFPMLSHICECKKPIHLICLRMLLKATQTECEFCKSRFCLNEVRTVSSKASWSKKQYPELCVFSPFDDIYPQPKSFGKIVNIKHLSLAKKLYCAICYLQIKRVSDILTKISQQEYIEYIMSIVSGEELDTPFKTIKLDEDGNIEKLILLDILPSNYSRWYNRGAIGRIEKMLNDKTKAFI